MNNYYKPGSWNVICQVCGFKYKSFQLRKRWDGLWVCQDDFEHRHPQDLIKIPKESTSVPWTRPEGVNVFTDGSNDTVCTYEGSLGLSDQGTADCARADISV